MNPRNPLTRYTIPISVDVAEMILPSIKPGQRRLYSYMNTINEDGKELSLQDWKNISIQQTLEDAPLKKTYKAYLFCTDNDYLEMANTRKFFKDNALNDDDSRLFEMPEVKSVPDTELRRSEESIAEELQCCMSCKPSRDSNNFVKSCFNARLYILFMIFLGLVVAIILITKNK